MISKYGGDALRLYLLGGNVMKGEDMIISEEHYRNQLKTTLLTLWNVYNFFVTYAISDEWVPNVESRKSKNVLDLWIRSKLASYAKEITQSLESFDTISYVESTRSFVDILSNWYIRRSRDRVGASTQDEQDKNDFYETCFYVLMTLCKLTAPLIPFVSEEMYRNLTGLESVHLEAWPDIDEHEIDSVMELSMEHVRTMAGVVHMLRKANNVPVRTPVKKFEYQGPHEIIPEYITILADETNVELFSYKGESSTYEGVQTELTFLPENLNVEKGEARKLVRDIQLRRKELKTDLNQSVDVSTPNWPQEYEEFIKNEALVRHLKKGEFEVTPV
jgi:isoleucyl-tRNA synthetase